MRTSQTEMIYVVQLYTSYGWEDVTASSLRWEALAERNTYRVVLDESRKERYESMIRVYHSDYPGAKFEFRAA